MKKTTSLVGQYFTIPTGVTVMRGGVRQTHSRDTIVCVRKTETIKGKTHIFWKSHGVMASTSL